MGIGYFFGAIIGSCLGYYFFFRLPGDIRSSRKSMQELAARFDKFEERLSNLESLVIERDRHRNFEQVL